MAILETFSLFLSPIGVTIGGFAIGGVVIGVLIYISVRNQNLRYGSWGERRILRGLGFTAVGFTTARALYRTLKWGIRNSISLSRSAKGIVKRTTGLARKIAKSTYDLVKNEEFNVELMNHEAVAAAATYEFSDLIRKFSNAEIREDQVILGLDQKINALISDLTNFSSLQKIDEEARKFVLGIGREVNEELIKLSENEKFQLLFRKKMILHGKRLIINIKLAEKEVMILQRRAYRNYKALKRNDNRSFRKIIVRILTKQKELIEAQSQSPVNIALNIDSTTANMVENAKKLEEDLIEKIQANLHILKAAHAQLDFMNSKALSTLRQIRDRLRESKKVIKEVYNLFEEVEPAEKDIKKESNRFSRGVTAAQNQISEMERESPEEILINLAGNGGVILESQIVLSKKILDVDEKYLLTLIGLVIDAMQRAYYAEEALRIGNEYFARLLKAHMGFEELVEKAINIGVLQGSDANSLTQEIQIEKMEAEISKVEEKAAQNEKSLFIKAIHTTEEARKTLHGHIDYINNLIKYTEQTKNYFLDSLAKLMEGMHAIKVGLNNDFRKNAQIYQKRMADARTTQTIEKLAA